MDVSRDVNCTDIIKYLNYNRYIGKLEDIQYGLSLKPCESNWVDLFKYFMIILWIEEYTNSYVKEKRSRRDKDRNLNRMSDV